MKTARGNLLQWMLDGKADVLVHGANCQNTMGAGIAFSIRREFSEAYAADCATPRGDRAKLGTFSYTEVVRGTAALSWRTPTRSSITEGRVFALITMRLRK